MKSLCRPKGSLRRNTAIKWMIRKRAVPLYVFRVPAASWLTGRKRKTVSDFRPCQVCIQAVTVSPISASNHRFLDNDPTSTPSGYCLVEANPECSSPKQHQLEMHRQSRRPISRSGKSNLSWQKRQESRLFVNLG